MQYLNFQLKFLIAYLLKYTACVQSYHINKSVLIELHFKNMEIKYISTL